MPAVIQSTLYVTPGGAVVPGSTQQNSRDDLRSGYQVVLHSVHVATTYSWSLSFASDSPGSTVPGTPFDGTESASALLAPEGSTSRDAKFNVDYEGTYLIRLVVDAGLPTEDTQFIRCRQLTLFGELKLVAAGERRDESGVVPVDASPEGWANDQNANLQRIALLLRRLSTSGRVLYVDANRGRDAAADQDDYDNVISIPGPEVARVEETGIKVRAMAHGDFTSINDAIAYAAAAAARGEPAPSKTNPYFIQIRPGFYTEDLNLTSFVHLIGESDVYEGDLGGGLLGQQVRPVIIRTVNAGGVGTHTYNPQAAGTAAECFLVNLYLENTANTTNAVLYQQGGLLALTRCVVSQQGDAATQGPAIQCETANPAYAPVLCLMDTQVVSEATTADRSALYFDAPESTLFLTTANILAESCNAVTFNPTLYENATCVAGQHSYLMGLVPFSGYPSYLRIAQSRVNGIDPIGLLISPPGGVGAKPGDVLVDLLDLDLTGEIQFNTTNAVGTTQLNQSNVTNTGTSTGLALPDAPGDLPTLKQYTRSDTLWYVKGYIDPRLGSAGTATIPVLNQVDEEDVQRILDLLWLGTFPVAGSPFYDLNAAYNGLASISPFTPGVGLGRNITAVGGAVQIQGATYPTGAESHLKHGGLQVEGIVDIGGFINGSGSDTTGDTGGSEIHLNPDQAGAGPFVGLGRATWPNGVIEPDRGFPGGFVVAGGAQAPTGDAAYHLHLRTADQREANTGKAGNVYVVAGGINDTLSASEAGDVHLIAGSHRANAGTKGNLWLVPGNTDLPSAGVVWFTGKTTGGNRAYLTPVNAYGAGVAGTIFFGTPAGIEVITFAGGENLAAAITLVNAQAKHFRAANVGGKLVLQGEFGPAGDILYLGDSVSGALNTALGDYILGNGATFTPGVYGHKVSVDVPQNGRLRVNGDLEYTGSLIPAPGGGAGLGTFVTIPPGVYMVGAGEALFESQPGGGAVAVGLPVASGGRTLVFRQEQAGSTSFIPQLGDTVLGMASIEIYEGEGICLVKNDGSDWLGWVFYTRPGTESYWPVNIGAGSLSILPQNFWKILGVMLTAGAVTTISLDTNMPVGRQITIKEESGIANALPGGQYVTIVDGGGATIDGAASLNIQVAYGSVTLYKNTSGNWSVI